MPTWVVTRSRGGAWNPLAGLREQALWDEHAAYMDAVTAEGFVLLAGPLYGDGTALHVVEAASEQEVEERFAADPWTGAGLLRTDSIRRWEILLRAPAQ